MDDLAAYRAEEVPPLTLTWRGFTIHTAPLTAGGLTVLQALATLKALEWAGWDRTDPATTQARVEAKAHEAKAKAHEVEQKAAEEAK